MKQRYYAVFWAILTLVVAGALAALAFRANFGATQREINPAEFHPPAAGIDSGTDGTRAAPAENLPDVRIRQTDVILSSPDGKMKLRLHSDAASASEGVVELPQAELEFFFAEEKKLYLLARDVRYEIRDETATVSGDLSGEIPALGERFTAKGLTWDRSSHTLTLEQATLIDPAFRTQARDITLNVRDDRLEIAGGVEVDI